MKDVASITADRTLTLVFLRLPGVNGFAVTPDYIATMSNPSFKFEEIAGDRSVIALHNSDARPEYGTLAHELFHVLFNRQDKTNPDLVERQYFPFNTRGNYPAIVSDFDVRARRRIQHGILEPINWVQIRRATKSPVPKTEDEIDYTIYPSTGNVFIDEY